MIPGYNIPSTIDPVIIKLKIAVTVVRWSDGNQLDATLLVELDIKGRPMPANNYPIITK